MKKYIALLIITLIFYSCSNKESVDPKKEIQIGFFLADKPLVSKSDTLKLGLRYTKNYSSNDEVFLTVNGLKISPSSNRYDSPNQYDYLFKVSPKNQVGVLNIKLTIKNNQDSFDTDAALRVVENRSLETLWDKLDFSYISNTYPYVVVDYNTNYLNLILYNATNPNNVIIGSFLDGKLKNTIPYTKNILIDGIYGRYELKYDDSKNLKEIYVLNGEPQLFQNLTYESVVNDVNQFYGPSKSAGFDQTGKRVTQFQTQRFIIVVGETGSQGSPLFTRITLK
ncbi:hypothetical protein [Pedobacter cryophilus]|uniref:Uncharacterized protein n=1 Tax=Pedobacter cryophilus TaxID=2571271 RepID=A0A4U1C6D9_9SPHI|nr:hypothetical protein [Pedobacter cryophilus]TKC00952.1 hypothetical protein FA046_04540 [Pedobacter cryophilus]